MRTGFWETRRFNTNLYIVPTGLLYPLIRGFAAALLWWSDALRTGALVNIGCFSLHRVRLIVSSLSRVVLIFLLWKLLATLLFSWCLGSVLFCHALTTAEAESKCMYWSAVCWVRVAAPFLAIRLWVTGPAGNGLKEELVCSSIHQLINL